MKFLIIFFVIIVCILGGLFVGSGVFLKEVTDNALDYLKANAEEFGFQARRTSYESVRLAGPFSVTWSKLVMEIEPLKGENAGKLIRIQFRDASLRITDLAQGLNEFKGNDLTVKRHSGTRKASTLKADTLSLEVNMDLENRENIPKQLREYSREVLEFISTGRAKLSIRSEGTVQFQLRKQAMQANVRTLQKNWETHLIMDEQDIRRIASRLSETLKDSEVKLLSNHPLRAPRLLFLRDKANRISGFINKRESRIPKDAYRYVLWSYLLTKEYGPEFAESVVRAHETSEGGAVQAESIMDLHNAKIGREYAMGDTSEMQLLRLVLTDPRVILNQDISIAA